MRDTAAKSRDIHRMQAWAGLGWAGDAAALARVEPVDELVLRLWREAEAFLPGDPGRIWVSSEMRHN